MDETKAREIFNIYKPLKELEKLKKEIAEKTGIKIQSRKEINDIVTKHYPNEVVIKNTLFRELSEKGITIFELNCNHSRLDLSLMTKESVAYEVKTFYDSYDRLEKQLESYSNLFEKVYIVIPEEKIKDIPSMLSNVGIITYQTPNLVFKVCKEAKESPFINSEDQLKTLTKSQLNTFLKYKLQTLSGLSKKRMIQEVLDSLSPQEINFSYKKLTQSKYRKRFEFLKNVENDIGILDFQFFFKNNIPPKIIFK